MNDHNPNPNPDHMLPDPSREIYYIMIRSLESGMPIGFLGASWTTLGSGRRVYHTVVRPEQAMAFGAIARAMAFALTLREHFPRCEFYCLSPESPISTNPVEFN